MTVRTETEVGPKRGPVTGTVTVVDVLGVRHTKVPSPEVLQVPPGEESGPVTRFTSMSGEKDGVGIFEMVLQ